MIIVKLTGESIEIEARDITRDFAKRACEECGWDLYSPAYYDLAKPEGAHPEFLLEQARIMFPNADSIEFIISR